MWFLNKTQNIKISGQTIKETPSKTMTQRIYHDNTTYTDNVTLFIDVLDSKDWIVVDTSFSEDDMHTITSAVNDNRYFHNKERNDLVNALFIKINDLEILNDAREIR